VFVKLLSFFISVVNVGIMQLFVCINMYKNSCDTVIKVLGLTLTTCT